MPIQISKSLISKLPASEQPEIETRLWEKSGGFCFLCDEPLVRTLESIEADHDVPEDQDGETTIANLNLAHAECNRAKRNAKTVPIRPYLRLKAYIRKTGPRQKYDGFLTHFDIEPKPSIVARDEAGIADFELPDGKSRRVAIYQETNGAGSFEYSFVELPRAAIFNDNDVQPRPIKDTHAWLIYSDLQRNPLHEPPSCRLEPAEVDPYVRILMFDGQHKTVANWMMGRESVVAKVYLDLDKDQATKLVNSIQSRIPKLPLSPFELAAKMEQEWRARLDEYEQHVGSEEASEAGFFKWLQADERARGKAAFKEALLQSQLSNPDLRISSLVRTAGAKAPANGLFITETTLKGRVLGRLLQFQPLSLKGEEFGAYRAVETENIALLLNAFTDAALSPPEGQLELLPVQAAAAKRMLYQSALSYVADLLKKVFAHTMLVDDLGAARPEDAKRQLIEAHVQRLTSHPVWTEQYARDQRMADVRNALEKNQDARRSFEEVGLDLAYLVVGEESAAFKKYWRNSD